MLGELKSTAVTPSLASLAMPMLLLIFGKALNTEWFTHVYKCDERVLNNKSPGPFAFGVSIALLYLGMFDVVACAHFCGVLTLLALLFESFNSFFNL